MATRNIYTGIARAISVNLTKPYAHQVGDQPKFTIQLGYPKTGQVIIDGQLMANTNWDDIFVALQEVTMEQFQQPFDLFNNPAMGVQYPPKLADGDLQLMKDANKNPIPGSVDPHKAGMWLISAKNVEKVGTAGPDGKAIDASAIYRGCWVSIQIEVQAFDTAAGNRVISLRLLNVQKCYDDARFDGRAAPQSAPEAFATRAITNTNIPVGQGQVAPTIGYALGQPAQQPIAPQMPVSPTAPQQQVAKVAPQAPQQQAAPAPQLPQVNSDPVIMNPGEASYAEFINKGWDAAGIIAAGHGVPNYTQ